MQKLYSLLIIKQNNIYLKYRHVKYYPFIFSKKKIFLIFVIFNAEHAKHFIVTIALKNNTIKTLLCIY